MIRYTLKIRKNIRENESKLDCAFVSLEPCNVIEPYVGLQLVYYRFKGLYGFCKINVISLKAFDASA